MQTIKRWMTVWFASSCILCHISSFELQFRISEWGSDDGFWTCRTSLAGYTLWIYTRRYTTNRCLRPTLTQRCSLSDVRETCCQEIFLAPNNACFFFLVTQFVWCSFEWHSKFIIKHSRWWTTLSRPSVFCGSNIKWHLMIFNNI